MIGFPRAALGLLLVLALPPAAGADGGPGAALAESAELVARECGFAAPPGASLSCWYLYPRGADDSGDADGEVIRLPVVALRRHDGEALRRPLLYLEGGPGYPAGVDEAGVWLWWNWLQSTGWDNDFVLFDPRGTGGAVPRYHCREYEAQIMDILGRAYGGAEDARAYAEAMQSCYRRLRAEGARLEAFTTAATAADAAALMRALGGEDWSVFAVSYGTRVALALLRDFPDAVERVVLDSVYPNDVEEFLLAPSLFDGALRRLFAACAGDPACAGAYPALERVTWELVTRLDEAPVSVAGTSRHVAGPIDVMLTGDRLLTLLYFGLYRRDRIEALPAILHAAHRGRTARLRPLVDDILDWLLDPDFSDVVMHSVHCHDRRPDVSREDYERAAAPFPRLSGLFASAWAQDICRFWEVGSAPPRVRAPVSSPRPALILAGAFDPVTPPHWAREVAERFPASQRFEFPAVGHGAVFSDGCATELAGRFLDDRLDADPPACATRLQAPRFRIDDGQDSASR